MLDVLQEVAGKVEGDELVVCILSQEQWKDSITIQQADMLVAETSQVMDIAVHLLRTNHLLICIRSSFVTHDVAEETLRVFLSMLGHTTITELV